MLTIIGPSSRLAKALGMSAPGREFSLRPGAATLPSHLDGTLLVFADPPSVAETQSAMLDLMSRIGLDSDTHVILVSSISATNALSSVYPVEGPYARRKRLAEDIVRSRQDVKTTIVRVGNVREYGGWHAVFTGTRLAILPVQASHAAIADIDSLRQQIAESLSSHRDIVNAFSAVPVDQCFRKVVHVSGLLWLYRQAPLRIGIKIAAKLLRRIGVYLPSPDDLNAFLVKEV